MIGGRDKPRSRLAALAFIIIGLLAGEADAEPVAAAKAQAVSDVIGMSPVEVRERLAAQPQSWPLYADLTLETSQGTLILISLGHLLLDPVSRETFNRLEAHSEAPVTGGMVCQASLLRSGAISEAAGSTLLFRDNKLEAVLIDDDPPPEAPAPAPARSPSDWRAMMKRPRSSWFIAHPGDLPLDDGPGFLGRWPKHVLGSGDALSVSCIDRPGETGQIPPKSERRVSAPTAGDFQGLALLPFAVTLPFKNAERVRMRERAKGLLERLKLGEALPEGFLDPGQGVEVHRAPSPSDYVVLSIDKGSYPSRNLSNTDDVALVGVRAGRVEWIAPSANYPTGSPSSLGLSAGLLCLNPQGAPGPARKGCTAWGSFEP